MEKISIVMAVYNEPKLLIKHAIDSILNQTYTNIELIVIVDNPDNQDAISFINTYQDVHLIVNEKNMGLPYSLNVGVKTATGEIIARMDGDDISLSTRIEDEYMFLKQGGYDLISSNISYIDENGDDIEMRHIIPPDTKCLKKLLKYVNCMSHPTFMFTRELFRRIGGYKEELIAAQDYEFVWNAISQGAYIGYCPKVLLKYRIRNANISHTKNDLQRFVTYYVQQAYIRKKGYNRQYVMNCLSDNNSDYYRFRAQYSKYRERIESLSKVQKVLVQIYHLITMKYIRNMLINYFKYLVLVKRYRL